MQWLLVTDLDNTLVGDEESLLRLNQWLEAARTQQHIRLVYSTGRSLSSYHQLCQTAALLAPDVLVTSVGTEVYLGNFEHPDPQWSLHLQQNWDRTLVEKITERFDALLPQSKTEQRPFKVSYFLNAAIADSVIAELSKALKTAGVSAQLIYSGSKDLDILPQTADKGKALQFVQTQFGMTVEQTIACGDSGNDIALFGKNRGIIVGNAQPELLNWYQQNLLPQRYLATNHYAAGIMEGLRHFGLLSEDLP